jgi:predicted MFS family arabinose efflux permease
MRAFAVFLFAYVLSQFFRSFLAVIAPELGQELGLDAQALANMQAAWIWAFVAMQIPVGWALDVIGPRRTVPASMTAAVLGSIVFASAHSALALMAAMALIGAGCSALFMAALYVFGRTSPPQRFAFLTSLLIGIGSAGNLLAATPLAFAAETIGWRGAMLGIGGAAAASAALCWLWIIDPPATRQQRGEGLKRILALRALWPILPLTAVSYSIILAERGLWAGPYFSDVHGLAPLARGNALLAMAAAMSLGALAYGPIERLFDSRKCVVFAGGAASTALLAVLALAPLGAASAVIVMAALGACAMSYAVLMAHGRSFMPDHLLGRGLTFLNMLFIGGAGVLQPVSGWIASRMRADGAPAAEVYATLHLSFAALLAMALAVYLLSSDRRRSST